MGTTLGKAVETALRGELKQFFQQRGGMLIIAVIVFTAAIFGGLGVYAGAVASAGLPALVATAVVVAAITLSSSSPSKKHGGATTTVANGQLPPHLRPFALDFSSGSAPAASLGYQAASLAYNIDREKHWDPFVANEVARGAPLDRVSFFRTNLHLVGEDSRHYGVIGNSDDTLVVGFRGTDQEEGWLHNFDARCEKIDAIDVDKLESGATREEKDYSRAFLRALKTFLKAHPKAGVHRGFLDGVVGSLAYLWGPVDAWCAAHPSGRVLVSGHSLGGAMATVFAAGLRQHLDTDRLDGVQVELVTFGAPRAFTASAIKHTVSRVPMSRYVAQAVSATAGDAELPRVVDPVTMVPPPIAINAKCDAYAHDGKEFKVRCKVGDSLLDGAMKLMSEVTMGTATGLSGPLMQLHKMDSTYAKWSDPSTKQTNSGEARVEHLKSLVMGLAVPKPDELRSQKDGLDRELRKSVGDALAWAASNNLPWVNAVQCFVANQHWGTADSTNPAAVNPTFLVDAATAMANVNEAFRQAQARTELVLAMGTLSTVYDSGRQTWNSAKELLELRATTSRAEKTVKSIKRRLELNRDRIEWVVQKFLPDRPRAGDDDAAEEEEAAADATVAAALEPDGEWVDDADLWPSGSPPEGTAFSSKDSLETHVDKLERRLNALDKELDDVEVVVNGVSVQLRSVRDAAAQNAAAAAVHTLVNTIQAVTTRSPVACAAAAAHGVSLLSAGSVAWGAHASIPPVTRLSATIHECRIEIAKQRGMLDKLRTATQRRAN